MEGEKDAVGSDGGMDIGVDGFGLQIGDEITVALVGTATDGFETKGFFHRLGLKIRTEFGELTVVFGHDDTSFAMPEDTVLFVEPRRQVGFGIGELIAHRLGVLASPSG